MRKRIVTGFGCTAVLACLFAITVLLVRTGASETALAAEPEDEVVTVGSMGTSGMDAMEFIVREDGGKVCVFQPSNGTIPTVTTDIAVDTLREADRQALYAGIRVTGRENLLALLEDFGS